MQKGTLVQKVVWLRRTQAVNFKLSLWDVVSESSWKLLYWGIVVLWRRERAHQHQVSHHICFHSICPGRIRWTGSRWKQGLHYIPSSLSLALVGYALNSFLCLEHPGSPNVRFTCRRLAGGWICLHVHYPRCALPNICSCINIIVGHSYQPVSTFLNNFTSF